MRTLSPSLPAWLAAAALLAAAPAALAQSSGTTTADEEEAVLINVGDEGQRERARDPRPPTYSTMGITRATADFDNLDDAWNIHAILGINVPKLTWLSVEIDLSQTLIPGENKEQNCSGGLLGPNCSQSDNDLRLSTVGLFGTVRTPGNLFGVARYGVRYVDSTSPALNEESSGSAWTLGAGYRWDDDAGIELNYTKMAEKLEYLTLNFLVGF